MGHRKSQKAFITFVPEKPALLTKWEFANSNLSVGLGDRASPKEPKVESDIAKEPVASTAY